MPGSFFGCRKKEIANIPFLKQVFACMKAYMIDREDVRQAMQVIIDVTNEVKSGRNYLILRREQDLKREINRGLSKEEASNRQQRQNVRSFRWH